MSDTNEQFDQIRHSCAHLLAAAVKQLWPGTHNAIGPSIENGFYQDFDFGDRKISEEDLPRIEEKMHELLKSWHAFDHHEVTVDEARELFKDNPYKLELLEELAKNEQKITVNDPGNFLDLCKGGHAENPPEQMKYFKLLSLAGAYWRGKSDNQMLQRIYGTCWSTQEELDNYLVMLEEAKLRDHRKLGKELELFTIDDMVGKGLVLWLPKGTIVRDQIELLARTKEAEAGYERVITPHIAKEELFITSGHLPYYKDSMYPPMEMDDGTYYLKAMNCPHHHRIFGFRPRSYREMPIRLAEYGTVYRNELSGTLAGLLRVRALAMNDAHIYCTKDQIKTEFTNVLRLTMDYFRIFGLQDYWFRLSKWSPAHTEKYFNEPAMWTYSEGVIRDVLTELGVKFVEVDDEAAFYGPKVDIQFRSVIGREETMSTVQLDFAAKERFGLSYVDDSGQSNSEVYVIHRAPLSTHERFMAFLIEHYAGKFPLWLAPVQVKLLPIADRHADYAAEVASNLRQAGFRVEVDAAQETIGKKIRHAQGEKVPYMLVVGDKEIEAGSVAVRSRDDGDQGTIPVTELITKLTTELKQ